MAFKAGFVRHDGYHAMIAATALLSPLISSGARAAVPVVVLAVLCWATFDVKYARPVPDWIGAAGFARASEAGHRQGLAAGDARFDLPAAPSPGQGWR